MRLEMFVCVESAIFSKKYDGKLVSYDELLFLFLESVTEQKRLLSSVLAYLVYLKLLVL